MNLETWLGNSIYDTTFLKFFKLQLTFPKYLADGRYVSSDIVVLRILQSDWPGAFSTLYTYKF